MHIDQAETIIDCLSAYSQSIGEQPAYTFLPRGKGNAQPISYQGLQRNSMLVAQDLIQRKCYRQRAILLYPAGLDFLYGLYGCFYAGVIAVPCNLSRGSHHLKRLNDIIDDAQAAVILTTSELKSSMECQLGRDDIEWLAFDFEQPELNKDIRYPAINKHDIAFIQYTSGSTSKPKGVMVSHHNLLQNIIAIRETFGTFEHIRIGGWLPQFHDMGLIGNILHTVGLGGHYIFMPPLSFIQRPIRWLELMAEYQCDLSTAPNFAYDLCVERIKKEQLQGLNLSSWKWAGNGAETVHPETIDEFCALLEPSGFRRAAMTPCYGMAETTLMVTASGKDDSPLTLNIDPEAMAKGQLVEQTSSSYQIAGCGFVAPNHEVLIVDPDTCQPLRAGQVGEIWVSGPSVAVGYWNKPEKTEQDFGATTQCGKGPYLRTGDLGLIKDKQLVVSGRLKDLFIIRGRNIYPQDMERYLANYSDCFRLNKTAAFSIGQEVVLLQEVEKSAMKLPSLKELKMQAMAQLVQEFDVTIKELILIKANTIPMTSSGKVQRALCSQKYLEAEFTDVC